MVMARRDAKYTMMHIEKLDKIPFTVAEPPSTEWLIHGYITLPVQHSHFNTVYSITRYADMKRWEMGTYKSTVNYCADLEARMGPLKFRSAV